MQHLWVQPAGPSDGLSPEPLDDVPRLAEASWVCRAHLGPVGIPPVELGVDQRSDVDTIDRQVHDLALYVGIDHLDAAEPGPSQVAGAELRAAEVDALEPGPPEILTEEVSHTLTVTSPAEDPLAHRHEEVAARLRRLERAVNLAERHPAGTAAARTGPTQGR